MHALFIICYKIIYSAWDRNLRLKHVGIWRTMHCRLCINCYGTGMWMCVKCGGGGGCWSPPISRLRSNLYKDDSAMFSRFLHWGKASCQACHPHLGQLTVKVGYFQEESRKCRYTVTWALGIIGQRMHPSPYRDGGHEQLISNGGRFKPVFAQRDKKQTMTGRSPSYVPPSGFHRNLSSVGWKAEPTLLRPNGGRQLVFKTVCRDSSEVNLCLPLIFFGRNRFKTPTIWDQLFLTTVSGKGGHVGVRILLCMCDRSAGFLCEQYSREPMYCTQSSSLSISTVEAQRRTMLNAGL